MKIQEIRAIAKQKGVNSARMKKADLIRSIQRTEGNFDCFGTPAGGGCDQSACAWRDDCLPGGNPRKTRH
jgi:phosphomevalonate kinase